MIIFNRILPYLSASLIIASLAIWISNPEFTFYIAVLIFVINIAAIWSLSGFKVFSNNFWNFLSTPLLFLVSSFAFFMMLDSLFSRIAFTVCIGFVYFLILRNIFSFLYQTKRYQPYALENIYSYVNMLSLFLFYAAFFGFSLLLGWSIWYFVILTLILSTFLFLRTLWSYKIVWLESKIYVVFIGVVMMESFYIVSLLPTSYLFNALTLIIIYYFLTNIIKDHLRVRLENNSVRKYLIISVLIMVISIFTTRWY